MDYSPGSLCESRSRCLTNARFPERIASQLLETVGHARVRSALPGMSAQLRDVRGVSLVYGTHQH